MDLAKKLEYAKSHVDSMATHDDEDLQLRAAALYNLKAHVDAAHAAAQSRLDEKLAAFGPPA